MRSAPTALITLTALIAATACSGDDSPDFCLPQGQVVVGAIGSAGSPLSEFADCYSGGSPALSLDGARAATVTMNEIVFDEPGLSATVAADSCRITITYTYQSMLTDGTPAAGTLTFAAAPNPDDAAAWSVDATGSNQLEWTNERGDTNVCGNQLDGVVIAVE